jgi:DNA polymerase-3 subunit delta'
MNFSDIIGQETVVSGLKNIIENKTVGHAYIFIGPEGVGKKMTASIFVNTLMCEEATSKPCGTCSGCKKIETGNHPDVYIVEGDSSTIGVEEIRNLKKDIYIKPYEAERKIYIIQEAQKLTEQAQNTLLKVLEEPPKYGTIILISTNAGVFLDTILSRALVITFRPHPYDIIERYLSINYPELKEELPFIAGFSGGIIGKAKEIAVSLEYSEMRRAITKSLMSLLSNNELDVLNTIENFEKYKSMTDSVFEFLLLWVRDVIFIKGLKSTDMIINIDMIDKVKDFSKNVTTKSIYKIAKHIIDTKRKVDQYANFNLAVEAMLINSWEEVHGNYSGYKV